MSEAKLSWKARIRGYGALAVIVLVGFLIARGLMLVADRFVGEGDFPRFLAPVEASLRGESDRVRLAAAFTRRLQDAFPAPTALDTAREMLMAGGFEAMPDIEGAARFRARRRVSFACEDVFVAVLMVDGHGAITGARGEVTANCL